MLETTSQDHASAQEQIPQDRIHDQHILRLTQTILGKMAGSMVVDGKGVGPLGWLGQKLSILVKQNWWSPSPPENWSTQRELGTQPFWGLKIVPHISITC